MPGIIVPVRIAFGIARNTPPPRDVSSASGASSSRHPDWLHGRPHLYARRAHHVITAEGGTGGDTRTMARARTIDGPYELHPDTYVLTSRDRPDVELQRAGHGDLVETPQGETYLVHLCGRPLRNRGRCTLGRETAIQPMVWSADGWLRTTDGAGVPRVNVAAPNLPPHPFPAPTGRVEFDAPALPIEFQWLRSPWPEDLFSLTARPGHLRSAGVKRSAASSAGARRTAQSHCYRAETRVDFEPRHFQQMADRSATTTASSSITSTSRTTRRWAGTRA